MNEIEPIEEFGWRIFREHTHWLAEKNKKEWDPPTVIRPIAGEFRSWHTLELKDDHTARWTYLDITSLKIVPESGKFVSVAIGSTHCLCLRDDGAIECWAWEMTVPWNDWKKCPCKLNSVARPQKRKFIDIAGGKDFSMGLRNDGIIEVWGSVNKIIEGKYIAINAHDTNAWGIMRNGTSEILDL